MTKNPKVIAGIIGIVVLLAGCIVLATYMIPTIKEVQREMSLTPTPLPPVPDTVREKPAESMVTPEPALHNGSQGEKVWKLQERLQALALDAVEIGLADHIVVADDDFVSLAQSGLYHPDKCRLEW